MASLSIFVPEGIAIGCANPIYPIGNIEIREGATLTFELLEVDSKSLERLIGKIEQFGFGRYVFCGELLSLEPCEPTVPALSALAKPIRRGVIKIHKMVNSEGQPS